MPNHRRGRPRKYAEYDALLASLPKPMTKRPKYVNGIGVFRGSKGDTAWIKVRLPQGGAYKGKSYRTGDAVEIKLGHLSSWSWEQLEAKRDDLQGRADRGEQLEDQAPVVFEEWATRWLERARSRLRSHKLVEVHLKCPSSDKLRQMRA